MSLGFSIQDLWAGNLSEEVLNRSKIFSDALGGGSGVPTVQPTTLESAESGLLAELGKAAKHGKNAQSI